MCRYFSPLSLLLSRRKSKSFFNSRLLTGLPISILVPLLSTVHPAARVHLCNRIIPSHCPHLKSSKAIPSQLKPRCTMSPTKAYRTLLTISLTWSLPLCPSPIRLWPHWLSFCSLNQSSLFLPQAWNAFAPSSLHSQLLLPILCSGMSSSEPPPLASRLKQSQLPPCPFPHYLFFLALVTI